MHVALGFEVMGHFDDYAGFNYRSTILTLFLPGLVATMRCVFKMFIGDDYICLDSVMEHYHIYLLICNCILSVTYFW